MLMPGTLTEKMLPVSFWEKLAAHLKGKGYAVFTNYNGKPGETMIDGTTPLASSLKEMAELADAFSLLIGVRSGACDLMALSGAKMAILFNGKQGEDHIEMSIEDRPNGWLGDIEDNKQLKHFLYFLEREKELIEAIERMLPE